MKKITIKNRKEFFDELPIAMNKIIVKNQEEFDKLPNEFRNYTEIQVRDNLDRIDRTFINAEISLYGSVRVESISNSAQIGNMYDSSRIEFMLDSTQVGHMSDSAQVGNMYDSAQVKYMFGSTQIEDMYGFAQVGYMLDSAQVKYMYGLAQIKYISMNSAAKILSTDVIIHEARQNVTLIYQDCTGSPGIKDDSATISYTKRVEFSLDNFIRGYDVKTENNKLVLYKFVRKNYTDFFTGKIRS